MVCNINANLKGIDGKALKIVAFFVEKGLTPEQGCAIAGNVSQESGYDESVVNSKSGAYGLFQYIQKWSPDFERKPDFYYQLEYTWGKFNTGQHKGDSNKGSATWKKWKDTNLKQYFLQRKGNLETYTELWMCAFERCGVSEANLSNRINEAKRVAGLYNQYASGECSKIDLGSSETNDSNTVNNNGMLTDVSVGINCPSPSFNVDNSDSTQSVTGFSGKVTNPKMKKVLSNLDYFYNAGSTKGSCKSGTYCPLTGHSYLGKCTYGPTTFYKNAGIDLHFWCGNYGACRNKTGYPIFPTFDCIKKTMDRYDFYLAGHWDFDEARALPTSTFRPGDVATLAGSPCGAHGLMWTGYDWRSDVIEQNICSAYPRMHQGKFGNYSVCIWRRADCQEPGLDTTPVPCTICK